MSSTFCACGCGVSSCSYMIIESEFQAVTFRWPNGRAEQNKPNCGWLGLFAILVSAHAPARSYLLAVSSANVDRNRLHDRGILDRIIRARTRCDVQHLLSFLVFFGFNTPGRPRGRGLGVYCSFSPRRHPRFLPKVDTIHRCIFTAIQIQFKRSKR